MPAMYREEKRSNKQIFPTRFTCRYGYIAVVAGVISVSFSVMALLTQSSLLFQFGWVKEHIDPMILSPVHVAIWLTSLMIFWVYPLVIRKWTASCVLAHGIIPVLVIMMRFWPETSSVVAIANIAAFSVAIAGSSHLLGVPRARAIILSLATVSGISALVELLAFGAWLASPRAVLDVCSSDGSMLSRAGRFDITFFYALYGLVPCLIVLLMVSPLLLEVTRRRVGLRASVLNVKHPGTYWALLFFLAVSGLIACLPYYLGHYPVGIDAQWYYERLASLSQGRAIGQVLLEETWTPYLLLPFSIQLLTQLPVREAFMWGSAITSMILTLGSFLVVRETTGSDQASLLAALFAAFSPQTLVATLASIFGNWLALAEIVLFFALLLHSARRASTRTLLASIPISLLVMLTHPWSWAVLMITLFVYLALSMLHKRPFSSLSRSVAPRALAGSLFAGLVGVLIGSRFLAFQDFLVSAYSREFVANLQIGWSPLTFLRNIQIALFNYDTQGMYSNWLLLALAIVGVFSMVVAADDGRTLLASWILGPSLLFCLLNPEIEWRLLFLIPYHIFAAIGVYTLLDLQERYFLERTSSPADVALLKYTRFAFVAFLCLVFLNNAVRSMALIASVVVL